MLGKLHLKIRTPSGHISMCGEFKRCMDGGHGMLQVFHRGRL